MESSHRIKCSHGRNHERAGHERRHLIMGELHPGPGIQQVGAKTGNAQRAISLDSITHRVLHEGVRNQNEVAGKPAPECDRYRCQEMIPRTEPLFAPDQRSDKRAFQKEREHAFHGQRLSDYTAGVLGKAGPVRSELKLHRNAGDDTDRKIFGLNFAVGVVTGIPMEFQFGTNWAGFSKYAGGVIGQTLAMEGMFAFFLESAFVGALIWGEKRLGPRYHFLAAVAVALGSWLSGYFILVTNAFMQHPVGYRIEADGSLGIASLSAYLLNPWAWVQFAHNQMAALVTGSFVVAAGGAFFSVGRLHRGS